MAKFTKDEHVIVCGAFLGVIEGYNKWYKGCWDVRVLSGPDMDKVIMYRSDVIKKDKR